MVLGTVTIVFCSEVAAAPGTTTLALLTGNVCGTAAAGGKAVGGETTVTGGGKMVPLLAVWATSGNAS